MGFLDLDLPCDIRDIIADVRNLAKADDIKWDMIAMLALDLIGVIPVIGALKYSDEIGTLFKSADKVSEECWRRLPKFLQDGKRRRCW